MHRDMEHARKPPELVALRVPGALVHVGRPELHRRSGHRRYEGIAVAVEDLPALRLEPDGANLVVERCLQILRPRKHLQRPEAEEEDPEDDQRDRPEDPEPELELRREPVWLLDPRIRRQEAV